MTHAEPYSGPCPMQLQSPHGKKLKISFIGGEPYITYNPIGGSEFLVVKILAQKFQFIPEFIPERSYDIVRNNGTTYGMLFRVRIYLCLPFNIPLICNNLVLGFFKAKRVGNWTT